MTVRYVGIGGNNSNNGLSWVNRKLTLDGVEDSPVAAGDIVYVGPGTYRETLTVDVPGSSGNPIVYIADVTGAFTDGVGGVVRVTGSDNDTTSARGTCITATSMDYRTFRGFAFDMASTACISMVTACSNWIIEDCVFTDATGNMIDIAGTGTGNTVRRCFFQLNGTSRGASISHSSTVSSAGHLIENCVFISGTGGRPVESARVGGFTVRHCTFIGGDRPVGILTALAGGQTITVNNCIFVGAAFAVRGTTSGEITEDYNNFWRNTTDRTNTSTGSNSVAVPPFFVLPMLVAGIRYNPVFGELANWSTLAAKVGTGMSSDGLFGVTRPATDSKKSWGAIQHQPMLRETTTVHSSSAASLRLSDAGQHMMFVPVTNTSTTFTVQVQWEADYAGTKPSMTVRQPGQSDTTDTATGSSGSWEELSITLTPAATPGYVVVIFTSSNTATSGNYDCFFDSFAVS